MPAVGARSYRFIDAVTAMPAVIIATAFGACSDPGSKAADLLLPMIAIAAVFDSDFWRAILVILLFDIAQTVRLRHFPMPGLETRLCIAAVRVAHAPAA